MIVWLFLDLNIVWQVVHILDETTVALLSSFEVGCPDGNKINYFLRENDGPDILKKFKE